MGQKTNPTGFRLAVRRNWQSRWFARKKDFAKFLHEDQIIRSTLMEKLKQASVPRIFIERAVTASASRFSPPALVLSSARKVRKWKT